MRDEGPCCERCRSVPAVSDGLCGHCKWAHRYEVEDGVRRLAVYLENYSRFEQWCQEHAA